MQGCLPGAGATCWRGAFSGSSLLVLPCLSGASMKLRACGAPERTRPQLQTEGTKSPLVLRYLSVTSKLCADHILSSLTSCDNHPPPPTRAMTNTS